MASQKENTLKQKHYWQSFRQKNSLQSDEGTTERINEFSEKLPLAEQQKLAIDAPPSRRDFLKLMGFSTTAAVLAVSCDTPVRKAVSFLNRPNQEISGEADYFATTYRQGVEVVPVLAKVREGRPIKIEGNRFSTITNGVTSSRVQASILDLYNTSRASVPTFKGKEMPSLQRADMEIMSKLARVDGNKIAMVTSSIASPSTQLAINRFKAKYRGAKHVQYDAISYAAMLLANEKNYGKRAIPYYQLDKADLIVSFGADFLGTWLTPTLFAKQYAAKRKLSDSNPKMSRHVQYESIMTLTGSNADKRYVHKPSQTTLLLEDLLRIIKGDVPTNSLSKSIVKSLEQTAKELLAFQGKSVVLCGSNELTDQLLTNKINQQIGANGTTINWSMGLPAVQGIDSEMSQLIEQMEQGKIEAIIFADVNPVYTYQDGKNLGELISKLPLSISLQTFIDETALSCTYQVPSNHYLESWGDSQIAEGQHTFMQPAIVPLFKTRQWQSSLLKWSGDNSTYPDLVEDYWSKRLGSKTTWLETLKKGVTESTKNNKSRPFRSVAIPSSSVKSSSEMEIVLYQKVAIGYGEQSSNPWLQEMPDPISKATWGNYILISSDLGKKLLDIDLMDSRQADTYEVYPEKDVLQLTVNGESISLPALIMPGMQPKTIAVALGYGRDKHLGVASDGVGENAFTLLSTTKEGARSYTSQGVTLTKTGDRAPIAMTQTHHSYEGRTEVIKETSLPGFIAHPDFFEAERKHLVKEYAPKTKDYAKEATLYPSHQKNGIHWGMSVDLNACIGCGACVIACGAENNVAVVGKEEVLRGHEMHWLRIDRYFSGDISNPEVVHQPMMCQQCDNAPCENVCPVSATNHSSEGLNQMAYNRCVGTRYCANNCPYKVRRFNWADYLGADAVANNQKAVLTDVALSMNDDLTRMVLNPDVSVRSRGVMEKCSFCTQRLQYGKLQAKKEERALKDSDTETACMQACPTHAIMFGNAMDENSGVSKERNNKRTYHVLDQLHVLPNVSYLGKVRNKV